MGDEKTTKTTATKRKRPSSRKRKRAVSTKPTTRRDGVENLDNADDPLAGDMHSHLREKPEGAVDFYDNPPDAAPADDA